MKNDMLANVTPSRLFRVAPVLLVLHVLEEAPGFVEYANSLVGQYVTDQQFLLVNATGLLITILVAVVVSNSRDGAAVLLGLAWLSFFMGANSVLHITATFVHGRYSPGVVTSVLVYLPFYLWFVYAVVKSTAFRTSAIIAAIVIGALPMFAHGYLIIFEGTTLFQLS